MKKIPIIPECYKNMPGHTQLTTLDIMKIFGFKNRDCVSNAASKGIIPKHNKELIKLCSKSKTSAKVMYYWYLSTIRTWAKE